MGFFSRLIIREPKEPLYAMLVVLILSPSSRLKQCELAIIDLQLKRYITVSAFIIIGKPPKIKFTEKLKSLLPRRFFEIIVPSHNIFAEGFAL